ncbi:alpha/beta hydrolase [Streptomyces sp. NBC_01007]|nr:alpha/beta hydrolase [Streptomyces sp. NBC_01007]
MALRLVFIHGIGGPRRVEVDRDRWTAALAQGAKAAGHTKAASELLEGSLADVVFAYYGDLFHKPGAQGTTDPGLVDAEAEELVELLAEIIETQIELAIGPGEASALRQALAELRPAGNVPQGAGNVVRACINASTTLLDAGPWRKGGQWAGGKFLVRDLNQVARYLARNRNALDVLIRSVVAQAIGTGPSIVVAHSLGSVVAYETLHAFPASVPLLVTIGSPLAMRAVVWPHLDPKPCRTPPGVESWLNFWDRDDVIVPRPILESDVSANADGVGVHSSRVDSDGVWVHTATKYLSQGEVAGPVIEALQTISTPS